MKSAAFWRTLCPALTLTEEEAPLLLGGALRSFDTVELLDLLRVDGYLKLEKVFAPGEMRLLAQAVATVTEATGFPVFSLVYDEFWSLMIRLRPVLAAILGEEYQALPDSWVWRLLPDPEAKGWKPHRDRAPGTVLSDGTPQTLSVWIPLTDATPLNGCIYALPASLDERYHTYGEGSQETVVRWQDIRALPAQAGSVLCWTSQLLHWGGRSCQRAPHPRVSVAFEFQSSAITRQGPFLLCPHKLPSWPMRLSLISRQLLQYQHMVPLPAELMRWCREQNKHLPAKRSFASVLKNLMSG